MSAVFDVVREGGPRAIVARARLELLFDPGTFKPVRTNDTSGPVPGLPSGGCGGRAAPAMMPGVTGASAPNASV